MITIKELKTQKELVDFVKFPFKLYKNTPYWIPPIINDEVSSFDKNLNPVFEHADARFFVALKGSEIVGRIAAIINHVEVNQQGLKKMRFGWFDFIDDLEVSKALLDKVNEIGKENQLEFMEGPVGFSNLDKVGVMTEGFENMGTMITWYNHAYYIDHYKAYGLEKEKGYIESEFPSENADPKFFAGFSEIIQKRYNLRPVNFKRTKDLMPKVDQMFDLFNESYSKLSSFVPISERQKKFFKEKYISFINPEYIKFVVDANDKIVAFAIVMPSFAKALKKANGKLFPFGFIHLLWAKYFSKDVTFYLIGITPEYQSKGVTSILFTEFKREFDKRGIQMCHRTPELEDNHAIHRLWVNFNTTTTQKRQTMKKLLT
jgi:GNAT superfamily N-acetyltransferase